MAPRTGRDTQVLAEGGAPEDPIDPTASKSAQKAQEKAAKRSKHASEETF